MSNTTVCDLVLISFTLHFFKLDNCTWISLISTFFGNISLQMDYRLGSGIFLSWQPIPSEFSSLFAFSNIGDICIFEILRVDIFRLIIESFCLARRF